MRATAEPAKERMDAFGPLLGLVAIMWIAEMVDVVLGGRLDGLGIEPRDTEGLVGVVLAPFLHAGFGHLIANTIPLLLMGFAIALSGLARVVAVTVIVALVSGLGTWLIAAAGTVHIGASGLVFGYATYLISRGIFSRNLVHLALGGVIVLVFGTVLLGGLLPEEGVSWQAHLFGAIGGVLAARLLTPDRKRPAIASA
ncbi:MAG: rhomboid family intramembrane serine protease [Actinomycetota bacterium]|nr:rhomboid family intramembrane serine protease [Actinomycetota bacterium]